MSRYHGDGGGGGIVVMLTGAIGSAIPTLIGIQGLLNLQFLPAQLTGLVQDISLALGLPISQVSAAFLAGGLAWAPIWLALGRATA